MRAGTTEPCPDGRARMPTPATPMITAAQPVLGMVRPLMILSASTIQIGTVATSSAARPAGRLFSA